MLFSLHQRRPRAARPASTLATPPAGDPRLPPARRSVRTAIVTVVAAAGLLAILPAPSLAQCGGICKPNEVLVDEDADNCYCKDRVEYAACVRDAGRRVPGMLATCESLRACLRANDVHEEAGFCLAATTVIKLAPTLATVAGATIACAQQGRNAMNKAGDCLDRSSSCKADALARHRAAILACRE